MDNTQNKQIETNNLKILGDQLNYESLLNKKYTEYANQCSDPQLKNLCNEASQIHKQNFNTLKTYLESHQ
jgi:hypothetical protein